MYYSSKYETSPRQKIQEKFSAIYHYKKLRQTMDDCEFSGIELLNFAKIGLPKYFTNRRYLVKLNPEPVSVHSEKQVFVYDCYYYDAVARQYQSGFLAFNPPSQCLHIGTTQSLAMGGLVRKVKTKFKKDTTH